MFGKQKKNYTECSDECLMQELSKGDRNAFECLYERYFRRLVWFAMGFVGEEEMAEDAVQEVFVKIIEKPERFDTERKFSTWVYVVTANLCKQLLRNKKNRTRLIEENVKPLNSVRQEPNNLYDKKMFRERVQQVYTDLNDKEKRLYTLRFEQELKLKDIAEILELPEGSVKSGIYYLLKKFAYQLKDFSHE